MSLADYGWTPYFQSQLDIDDIEILCPVRVMAVHRGHLDVAGPDYIGPIPPFTENLEEDEAAPTAGDWLLIDRGMKRARRLLNRTSLFKRRSAGTSRRTQLIAANVDTLFIISSCSPAYNIVNRSLL